MFQRIMLLLTILIILTGYAANSANALDSGCLAADPIYFAYDSTTLSYQARADLLKVAELMNRKMLRVTLTGHTDERRSEEYALALGELLAKEVKKYLVTLGIKPDEITVMSYGKSRPADPRHNEEGWSKNRRVEFVFSARK